MPYVIRRKPSAVTIRAQRRCVANAQEPLEPFVARPREFNEADALDAIAGCFWARGIEAASLRDLEEACGLGTASLYGAFGGKREMFRAAL